MSLDRSTLARLSPRQYQLWLLLTQGFDCKGAAARMFIRHDTAAQAAHLIGKILGTSHRGLWMKLAIEEGIIPCHNLTSRSPKLSASEVSPVLAKLPLPRASASSAPSSAFPSRTR